MATTATATATYPRTWTEFYVRNRKNGDTIEELFAANMAGMTLLTVEHLANTGKLTDTIIGSSHANMIMVPGRPGQMHLLHHGFGASTSEGFNLIFIQGNLSDSAIFKMLPRESAVAQIRGEGAEGPRTRAVAAGADTLLCPSLNSMLGADTAVEFMNLTAEGNTILAEKPNHIMVTPEIFDIAKGNKTVDAKKLAFDIISWLEEDEDDEEELRVLKEKEALGVETLLAMLWASANQGLTPVILNDVPDDAKLNTTIRNMKMKVGEGARIVTPEAARTARTGEVGVENLALSSVVMALNRMHESQEADRTKKEAESSLFRTMGPPQKKLFTDLCTCDMNTGPEVSEFMKSLTRSKTPQKAVALLKAETRNWLGTFSEGGCHRLLSNGFLSIDANKSNPGGFTVFMFFPKALDISGKAFDGDSAIMRDYFGLEVDESTISYYTKQGYFAPENAYDLHIQLKTMRDMLELLTCKDSIAAKGLNYVLDQKRWDGITIQLHERFATEPNFGAKFCYGVDKPIQMLLDKMTKWTDIRAEGTPHYLTTKAKELMEAVEEGLDLRIMLPKVLLNSNKGTKDGKDTAKSTKADNGGETEKTNKKKRKKPASKAAVPEENSESKPTKTPTASHTNPSVRSAWKPPIAGTDYLRYFPGRMPGNLSWPRFTDARRRTAPPTKMCVRFQAVGKCSMACAQAHVTYEEMKKEDQDSIDKIFKEVYANEPSPL